MTANPVLGNVGDTDQRSKIETFNIAPTYTRIINNDSVFNFSAWVRKDMYHYFPSGNPLADLSPLQTSSIAQTRSLMQTELLGIWQRTPKTVIFVTHDVQEAVYLAERVAVMSARPGQIKTIVETKFAKRDPSILRSKEFVEKVDELWGLVRDEAIRAQIR